MSRFLSHLYLEYIENEKGCSLFNKDGRQLWLVTSDFVYESDVAGVTITVPELFVTDLASVPRIPFVYDNLGDIAQRPAVIHGYPWLLVFKRGLPHDVADKVPLEAIELTEIPRGKKEAYLSRSSLRWQ